MKTIGRILIIVAVFVLVIGITYVAVNANISSTTTPAFERGAASFPRPNGERPDFDRDGPEGGGWTVGLIRNLGILAIIVALIAVPKRILRRKPLPVRTD